MIMLLFLVILFLPSAAFSQLTCTQLGPSMVCSGPNNQSATVTELSKGHGVISGDRTMVPYAILPTPSQPHDLNHAIEPLPSMRSREDSNDGTDGNDSNGMSVKQRY